MLYLGGPLKLYDLPHEEQEAALGWWLSREGRARESGQPVLAKPKKTRILWKSGDPPFQPGASPSASPP